MQLGRSRVSQRNRGSRVLNLTTQNEANQRRSVNLCLYARPPCRFLPPGSLLGLMLMATPSRKSAARLLSGGFWRMDLDC
jgi:hypothetical protein